MVFLLLNRRQCSSFVNKCEYNSNYNNAGRKIEHIELQRQQIIVSTKINKSRRNKVFYYLKDIGSYYHNQGPIKVKNWDNNESNSNYDPKTIDSCNINNNLNEDFYLPNSIKEVEEEHDSSVLNLSIIIIMSKAHSKQEFQIDKNQQAKCVLTHYQVQNEHHFCITQSTNHNHHHCCHCTLSTD